MTQGRRGDLTEQFPANPALRAAAADFAERLAAQMTKKGLSQSDLARQIWGEKIDSRGNSVARNRGTIGQYLAGRGLPESENLKKLADALDCDVNDLTDGRPIQPLLRRNQVIRGGSHGSMLYIDPFAASSASANWRGWATNSLNTPAAEADEPPGTLLHMTALPGKPDRVLVELKITMSLTAAGELISLVDRITKTK